VTVSTAQVAGPVGPPGPVGSVGSANAGVRQAIGAMAHVDDWGLVQLSADEWHALAFEPFAVYKTLPHGGETLWTSTFENRGVVLSFDWHVALELGVLVRGQSVHTNALLYDPSDNLLSEQQHYLQAAITIHDLPWVREVIRKHLLGFDGIEGRPSDPVVQKSTAEHAAQDHHAWELLSTREVEVLRWTKIGKSAWEVGQILGINQSTVAKHVSSAALKLGCAGKHAAVLAAIKQRLIEP
jgi:DNA-binding CsgD family transcriptional regulator